MIPSIRKIHGLSARSISRLFAVAGLGGIAVSQLLLWLNDQIGTPAYWRACLAFLTVLEWTYLAAVASLLFGAPVLALLASRRRGPRASHSIVARALVAVVSLAISLSFAESIGAAWLHHARRTTVVPVGGLKPSLRVDRQTMWPPLSLADVPLPESFPDPPAEAEIDLVVMGESSAAGEPFQRLSIGLLVAGKLEEVLPGRHVRLHTLATSGDTLEFQHKKLVRLNRRPDLMIVYCGHNEFGSRLNGGRDLDHYLDGRVPSLWMRLVRRAESVSPLCELIARASEKCRVSIPPPPYGDRDLIDTPAYTPGEYDLLLADFRRRLETIIAYAGRAGSILVLIPPPGNDAGFEPNRSFLPAETPKAEREAFRRDFLAARALEERDPPAAIAAYRALIARQPGFAESHYRLGVLLAAAGDIKGADRHFVAARDCDGYPFRCPTAFQEVFRELASGGDVILVDAQAELRAISRSGLLDDRLFQDAMHPSFRGQLALAQAVLRGLRGRRVFGWPDRTPAPVFDPSECAARFGLDREAWKRICLWGIHFGTIAQGLRYDPAPRLQRKRLYAEAHERLIAGEAPEALGLPNVGLPEPVPALAGPDPPRMNSGGRP